MMMFQSNFVRLYYRLLDADWDNITRTVFISHKKFYCFIRLTTKLVDARSASFALWYSHSQPQSNQNAA